ncbi:MAG: twin-arginine translocation signal domain-containing protein [Acidobacteriota bacterium]
MNDRDFGLTRRRFLTAAAAVSVALGTSGCEQQEEKTEAVGSSRHIGDHLDLMRKLGMVAGIGAHKNETVEGTVKAGLKPDFYMKTINRLGYFAAEPDRTAEMMSAIDVPWIAFKILGAGRIKPEEGFAYALNAGADFLCVGMFEFQVEGNVQLARKLMSEMPG